MGDALQNVGFLFFSTYISSPCLPHQMISIIFCLHTAMLESFFFSKHEDEAQWERCLVYWGLFCFVFDSTFFISHCSASPYMGKFSNAAGSDVGWGSRKLTQANCQELKYECFQKQKNKPNQQWAALPKAAL